MPLVFTQNEMSISGPGYADVLGESYEYPTRYRNLVRTGTQFVYYRGRRTTSGPVLPQAYLGVGIVGEITPGKDGLLRCTIQQYQPFPQPLPFKDEHGYREPTANTATAVGFYYQAGVRTIDPAAYAAIAGAGLPPSPDHHEPGSEQPEPGSPPQLAAYPSPEHAAAVDRLAMDLACAEAARRFPTAPARRMPHNNPGYDLLITRADQRLLYVEVKGTTAHHPRFWLTEGERLFSAAHAEDYELWAFHDIDPEADTTVGELTVHAGSLTGTDAVQLTPTQWAGRLIPAGP